MNQPIQGAQAQVRRVVKEFYANGWNDYIHNIPFGLMQNEDEQNGWMDCKEVTKKYGRQQEM